MYIILRFFSGFDGLKILYKKFRCQSKLLSLISSLQLELTTIYCKYLLAIFKVSIFLNKLFKFSMLFPCSRKKSSKMYLYSLGTFNGYNKNNLYNSLNKLLSTLSVLVYKIKNDLLLYSSPNLK